MLSPCVRTSMQPQGLAFSPTGFLRHTHKGLGLRDTHRDERWARPPLLQRPAQGESSGEPLRHQACPLRAPQNGEGPKPATQPPRHARSPQTGRESSRCPGSPQTHWEPPRHPGIPQMHQQPPRRTGSPPDIPGAPTQAGSPPDTLGAPRCTKSPPDIPGAPQIP